jgi:hypothetical protein
VEVPIACALTVPERSERERRIADLAGRSLRSREATPDGVRLTFAADARTEHEVRAVVADEAKCCPFLQFRLSRTGEALVVEVTAPDQALPVLEEFNLPAPQRNKG